MRTQFLFFAAVTLAGACADVPGSTPSDFLVPSARITEVGGRGFTSEAGAPGCLTRYDVAGSPPGTECHTTFVGGDPHHFITTCPAVQPFLATTHEVARDTANHVVRELVIYAPPSGAPYLDETYHYDALGQLTDWQDDTDRDGIADGTVVLGDRDAQGQPRTASQTNKPWVLDRVYPSTARSQWSMRYDAFGRMVSLQMRFAASGNLHYDESISYDDRARRRARSVVIDLSGEIPGAGEAGDNAGYELFDLDGRLVETQWTQARGEPITTHFRYDEHGRLITTVVDAAQRDSPYHYTAHEIYDCP